MNTNTLRLAAASIAVLLSVTLAQALPKSAMVEATTAQGCHIYVHPSVKDKFLRFFSLLKENGIHVPCGITNCWAGGGHVGGSQHYTGTACDIQTGKNRGPSFIYHSDALAKEAGLHSGCDFRDCGHYEAFHGTHIALDANGNMSTRHHYARSYSARRHGHHYGVRYATADATPVDRLAIH